MTSVLAYLRQRTRGAHADVDAAFSHFDLSDEQSYVGFLLAHGRVLPSIEAELHGEPRLPPWRPRSALLARDLESFGLTLPSPASPAGTSRLGEQLGLAYVMEGSRLGGGILAARVRHNFSALYLGATHAEGEWRAFTLALDACASREGLLFDAVLDGATRGFTLFAGSARRAFASNPATGAA